MSRIAHIALKCGDMGSLETATKFYQDIFGIYQTKSTHVRGHISRHMTDGRIDLALMLYDSEDQKEAKLAGAGPRIHHIGIEVADRPSVITRIEKNGGSIYSDRAEGAMKYFSPDGIIGEIVAAGRYPTKSPSTLSRICNVTLQVRDIEEALAFYRKVFELEETKESCENIRILTDGRTELTLAAMPNGANPAIHSWTLEVKDPKAVAEQVTQFGGALLSDSAKGTVKFRAPDGNTVELAKAVG